MPITQANSPALEPKAHSGKKYHRGVTGVDGRVAVIDIYSYLVAFSVDCPARQHAIKKLTMAGMRGKGETLQDLYEARDAVTRAIQMQEQEMGIVAVPTQAQEPGSAVENSHEKRVQAIVKELRVYLPAGVDLGKLASKVLAELWKV